MTHASLDNHTHRSKEKESNVATERNKNDVESHCDAKVKSLESWARSASLTSGDVGMGSVVKKLALENYSFLHCI